MTIKERLDEIQLLMDCGILNKHDSHDRNVILEMLPTIEEILEENNYEITGKHIKAGTVRNYFGGNGKSW